ncbi:MAG: flagellar biosynthesis protein FliQ [Clostridiales bacterium]|jgi:flagellar biosynthetic protein FliQ|nr:flagellar biosynthesis protein FliQ [Clostridiales bacterium]
MTQGDILTICKDSVTTALMIAAPFLVLSLIIGLVISVLQAATQIHEQTITFVPKILSVALILIFLGSWIMNMMIGFTEKIFIYISNLA